ncbi:bifunctional diaminohydroxyphosphoribosylaminopyrimidine deaminase/5-amino-6-(5-phosphoribosylamino)uracil reductase RibD [candidate division KSB1 bacterium]
MVEEDKTKDNDNHYMKLALELARKGEGMTSPNPIVGAVIVKDGKIIGRGYHKKAAMPHAEVEAMHSVKDKKLLKGSTLYVNLEPCDHYGRTGPCTRAIINAGIGRVVAAMKDPNPKVDGKGFEELKNAGVEVKWGVMEQEAKKLNEAFAKFKTQQKPFVILKAAMSADGKIATRAGQSKWISSEESRSYVHELRNKVDAVIVGINTVLHDNPSLTCRLPRGRDPLRVILDSKLRIPLDARIFSDQNTIIATTNHCDKDKIRKLEEKGVGVIVTRDGNEKVNLKDLLYELALRSMTHIMVEGGSEVAASFLKEKLVDKVVYFIAPKIIGGRDAKTPVGGKGIENMEEALELKDIEIKKIGKDVVIEAYL